MAGPDEYKQLTLSESMFGRSGRAYEKNELVGRRGGGDPGEDQTMEGKAPSEPSPVQSNKRPHGSRCVSPDTSSEESEADSFSELDPYSLDECLSSASSRDSSPVAPRRSGGQAARRGPSAKRGCVQEASWYKDDWEPNQIPFTVTPGPQGAAAELESTLPADFLQLFLTDELLQHIVDQTNLYARQCLESQAETLPHSRKKSWRPVSIPELKKFLALTFLTGYLKKPSLEMYWSVDEMVATPFFSQIMSRNRFQLIWRFLHYNNNALKDATDKMYKVRPVLDYVVKKFKELYQPGQNICIDEAMMKWRGRLSFRVYHPHKPVKCGIKSYILCDSATGYCFNMQPDFGAASTMPDTVFSLLDRLPGHGYTLFMDNFYSSVSLCERLLGAQTNVCGTLRSNRGEPRVIKEVSRYDLGEGEKIVRHNGKVLVVAWQDERLVRVVTTCHRDNMERVDVRKKGQKNTVSQSKPTCVVAYNLSMKGVEKLDQNMAYYPFLRRSLNWSKKFVAYLFQLCMFNAYVLYRAKNPRKCKTLLKFMRKVVRSWTLYRRVVNEEDEDADATYLGEGTYNPRAPRWDPESRLDGQIARHRLEHLRSTSKKARPCRKCRVCARRGLRKETNRWCASCQVPLHAGECFTVYHTKVNYAKA